jgi:hypothetical protein
MITEDDYKCKERVHPDKIRRYLSYLNDPSLKPLKVHPQDSKLRFDAFKFFEIIKGKLYRKPEGKYTESREVVYQNQAFDIISRKHLHLGHPGRDPLFLALDQGVYGIKRSECYWINKWHLGLVEISLQINSQHHRTIGGNSHEVVFVIRSLLIGLPMTRER